MPEFRFYDIEGDDTHKALGLECMSPEELQVWGKAFILDIPEGYVLTVRKRKLPSGRAELLMGCVKVGTSLLLKGEPAGEDKPNPAAPAPNALPLPEVVKDATDEKLEVMAARAGIKVDQAWKNKSLPAKRSDVAKQMRVQNAG